MEKDIEYYQAKLKIAQELGNKQEEMVVLATISRFLSKAGKNKDAIDYDKTSLKLAQELGNRKQEQLMYRKLGIHCKNIKEYDTARECLMESLKIARELGDKSAESIVFQDIGVCLEKEGKSKDAIDYDRTSLKLAQELGNWKQEQTMYRYLALHYQNIEEYDTARECLMESLEIARERGDKKQECLLYKDLERMCKETGLVELSLDYYTKALKIETELSGNGTPEVAADKRNITEGEHSSATVTALGTSTEIDVTTTDRRSLLHASNTPDEGSPGMPSSAPDPGTASTSIVSPNNAAEVESNSVNEETRKIEWKQRSKRYHDELQRLVDILTTQPSTTTMKVGMFRLCLEKEFCIGKGSLGTKVHVGLCDDGREVAVKVLPLDVYNEFGKTEKDILMCRNISKHPSIVNYIYMYSEVIEKNGYLFLDLCEKTLDEHVQSCTEEELKDQGPRIMSQILQGLEALHYGADRTILHRDLRPSNILVDTDGEMLLADFGISRSIEKEQNTHESVSRGIPGWMAAESLPAPDEEFEYLSNEEVKVRYKTKSDIQVAGMLLFYILTKGMHPYGNRVYQPVNIVQGKPVNLKHFGDPVAKDLIQWMLQPKPEDKPIVLENV